MHANNILAVSFVFHISNIIVPVEIYFFITPTLKTFITTTIINSFKHCNNDNSSNPNIIMSIRRHLAITFYCKLGHMHVHLIP